MGRGQYNKLGGKEELRRYGATIETVCVDVVIHTMPDREKKVESLVFPVVLLLGEVPAF